MLLLQAIITALLSGLFSGAVMFGLNERRERNEIELRHFEEMFVAFAEWCDSIHAYHWHIWELNAPDFDYYKFNDRANALHKSIDDNFNRANFLIDVWAPELGGLTAPVLAIAKDLIQPRVDALKKKVLTGSVQTQDFEYVSDALQRLHLERSKALKQIVRKAREVAERPILLSYLSSAYIKQRLFSSRQNRRG